MESLLSFLLEKWPYAVWIAIGGIIVFLYFIIKNKAENAHTRIDNLPCKAHHEILDKYGNELSMQNQKLNTIDILNGKFDVMMQTLQTFAGVKEKSIIQSLSPISLSDYGISLSVELDTEKYISKNWEAISKYIETNSESMNPYDIQQLCFNYALLKPEEVLSTEGYDKFKSKAFILGIAVYDLLQAAAILIRDKFFKEHNINISDVDRFDPKNNK